MKNFFERNGSWLIPLTLTILVGAFTFFTNYIYATKSEMNAHCIKQEEEFVKKDQLKILYDKLDKTNDKINSINESIAGINATLKLNTNKVGGIR